MPSGDDKIGRDSGTQGLGSDTRVRVNGPTTENGVELELEAQLEAELEAQQEAELELEAELKAEPELIVGR